MRVFFFQAEDGIRDIGVTGVQTCALPICFTDWQRNELEVAELQVREQCRMVLEREARLLDQGRYKEWLELYTERCVGWVPGSEQAGDPRRGGAVFFAERPRLAGRLYPLCTRKEGALGP